MKRMKYGIRSKVQNRALFGYMVPMGFMEVVSGDTIFGSVNVTGRSASTTSLLFNNAYLDVMAFYIPYRLLWDQFTDFITDENSGLTPPTVANKWAYCFENVFTQTDVAGSFTELTPWQRRCYNTVWNSFFKEAADSAVSVDDNNMLPVLDRPSRFHQSEPEAPAPAGVIASSLSTDDIRRAFARDEFNKMRQYYGDRYVDFLNAMQIDVPWTILEEPEVIGTAKGNLEYKLVNATAEGTTVEVGQTAGYFFAQAHLQLKRTFCPEHGVVAFFAMPKLIQGRVNAGSVLPFLYNFEQFWKPEGEVEKAQNYIDNLWNGTDVNGSTISMPRYMHLRQGMDLTPADPIAPASATTGFMSVSNNTTPTQYKATTVNSSVFNQDIGNLPQDGALTGSAQIAFSAEHSLTKLSPLGTMVQRPLR